MAVWSTLDLSILSKMKARGSSYELTIGKYKPSYCDGTTALETIVVTAESLVPFWNLQGDSPCSTRKLDIVQPKFWQKKAEGVPHPVGIVDQLDVQGKVGIYAGSFVDAAVEAASKTQMAALIVTTAPLDLPAMPKATDD